MTALYIGGAYQGKTALAQKLHKDLEIVDDLQDIVQEYLQNGQDIYDVLPMLIGKAVICREIGLGIVPLDREKRDLREAVGRLCCSIAESADLVVRVSCGLPQVIKGELPCEF